MKKLILTVLTAITTITTSTIAGGNIAPENAKIAKITPVFEESKFYLGLGVGVAEVRDAGSTIAGNKDFKSAQAFVDAKIGYEITEFAALQVSGFIGENMKNASIDGVLRYENSSDFTPHMFVGYGVTSYKGHPYVEDTTATGVQFGAGLTYDVTKTWGATAEVREIVKTDDHVVSVGVVYSF